MRYLTEFLERLWRACQPHCPRRRTAHARTRAALHQTFAQTYMQGCQMSKIDRAEDSGPGHASDLKASSAAQRIHPVICMPLCFCRVQAVVQWSQAIVLKPVLFDTLQGLVSVCDNRCQSCLLLKIRTLRSDSSGRLYQLPLITKTNCGAGALCQSCQFPSGSCKLQENVMQRSIMITEP